jgi:hypothetical protein
LKQDDVVATIPTGGILVVPLVTPVGSAFVTFRDGGAADPVVSVTFTSLTTQRCRDLLGRYMQMLQSVATPSSGKDPVEMFNQLLVNLQRELSHDLRLAAAAAGATNGMSLRLVSQMGIGALPLHATVDDATKRTLYDDYVYSSIPSIGVVAYRRQNDRVKDRRTQTLLVVNPTGDLPYAPLEGHLVGGVIPPAQLRIVAGRAATKQQIMTSARTANLHFAGHAKATCRRPGGRP